MDEITLNPASPALFSGQVAPQGAPAAKRQTALTHIRLIAGVAAALVAVFAASPILIDVCAAQGDVNFLGWLILGDQWQAFELPWLRFLPFVSSVVYLALVLESRIRCDHVSSIEHEGHLNVLRWTTAAGIGFSVLLHFISTALQRLADEAIRELSVAEIVGIDNAAALLIPCVFIGAWTAIAVHHCNKRTKRGTATKTRLLSERMPVLFWFILTLTYCASPLLLAIAFVIGFTLVTTVAMGALTVIMLLMLPIFLVIALKEM